jgi:hypothetical protein
MADFDPYRKWLGIPPQEQPPNQYRLLGIGLFESDPDVIANSADRQMSHVRTFQSGAFAEISQFILNELTAARMCLLDPQRKAEYDYWLRQTLPADHAMPPPPRMAAMPPGMGPEGGAAAAYGGYPYAGAAVASAPVPPPPAAPAPWATPMPPTPPALAAPAGPRPMVVGPGPGQTAAPGSDLLAAMAAPATRHGRAAVRKKKDSMQTMSIGIALAALCFLLVLGFLAAYLSENGSSGVPSDDQPLIGPGAPIIVKTRPGKRPASDSASERAVEKPAPKPAPRTAQSAPANVRPVEESYGDIPVAPNVDRSAPVVPVRNPPPAAPPANNPPPNNPPANNPPANNPPPNAAPPGGNANPEPPGLDPDLRKDTLDKAVK